jgi:hypothetical protein
MTYEFSESKKVLNIEEPLVTRESLLFVCKEIDEDTAEDETTSYINTAHVTVCSLLDGYGIPLLLLTEIEKYLAAHFAVLAYPSIQREAMGPMSASYFGKLGLGFQNTRYGQSAIALDPTGVLKDLSDGKRPVIARLTSLGSGILTTPTSES